MGGGRDPGRGAAKRDVGMETSNTREEVIPTPCRQRRSQALGKAPGHAAGWGDIKR